MEWWHTMLVPVKRVWVGVANRVGLRKNGLVKLHNDVRTCEYEDVRVLWEMLKRNETELAGSRTTEKRRSWNISNWARRAPYLCRSF